MNVSLIVPTLNESRNIVELLERISSALKTTDTVAAAEIIIIDDGSTDTTVALAKSAVLPYPVVVIERTVRGLATAVLAGFAAAKYEVVGVIDADLSHPPELIPDLLARLQNADVAVGSRNVPGGAVERWPWYRKFSSQFATLLTRPLGITIHDPMSGYFFLTKKMAVSQAYSPLGYKILLEILVKNPGVRVIEVPYIFQNRLHGKSKMGMRESINYLRHVFKLYRFKLFGV